MGTSCNGTLNQDVYLFGIHGVHGVNVPKLATPGPGDAKGLAWEQTIPTTAQEIRAEWIMKLNPVIHKNVVLPNTTSLIVPTANASQYLGNVTEIMTVETATTKTRPNAHTIFVQVI